MKTLTIMSVLMAAISVNTFAADNCQMGSGKTASAEEAKKAEEAKGDAVDQATRSASQAGVDGKHRKVGVL